MDERSSSTRLAFEDWALDQYKNPRDIERDGEGYKLLQAQHDWEAWKACVERLGIDWHRYPYEKPSSIGSYLVAKSADGNREVEWAYFSGNSQWLSTTGFVIDGVVTHFSKPPRLPAR